MNKVLFSSKKQDWETPNSLFDELNKEFNGFNFDAAANNSNTKVGLNFATDTIIYRGGYALLGQTLNGLTYPWAKAQCTKVWLNPPYGKYITGKWVKKAYEESNQGCLVVALLPARVDTQWL